MAEINDVLGIVITLKGEVEADRALSGIAKSAGEAEGATRKLSGAQQELVARSERAAQAAQSVDIQNRKAVDTYLREVAQIRALAREMGVLAEVEQRTSGATRDVGAHLAAVAEQRRVLNAELKAGVAVETELGAATGLTRSGLNSLRASLTSTVASLAGAAPGVAQFTGALGTMALGSGLMVGVLAGMAAIGYAWDKITESARKAAKEQDAAIDRAEKLRTAQRQGAGGQTVDDITTLQQRLAQDRQRFADLSKPQTFGFAAGKGIEDTGAIAAAKAKADDIKKVLADIAVDEAQVSAAVAEQGARLVQTTTNNLAQLVTSHNATAAEIKNAEALLTGFKQSLAALSGEGSANAKRAELIAQIKELDEALHPKAQRDPIGRNIAGLEGEVAKVRALSEAQGQSALSLRLLGIEYDRRAERSKNAVNHTAAETAALNRLADARARELGRAAVSEDRTQQEDRTRTVQRSDSTAIREAEQVLELARLTDEAAKQRRVDMQAENELAAARYQFALATKNLDAETDAAALKGAQDIYASTERRIEAVRRIGHETVAVTQETDRQKKAADEATREQERRAKQIERTLSGGIERFFTDVTQGKNPFEAVWDEALRGYIRLESQLLGRKLLEKLGGVFHIGIDVAADKQVGAGKDMLQAAEVIKAAADEMLRYQGIDPSGVTGASTAGEGSIADASTAVTPGLDLQSESKAEALGKAIAKYAMPAIVGYAIGQGTQNPALGALGGAAAGFATAGPWGALVGGVAGLVGGLLGARDAAAAAAEQLKQMQHAAADAAEDFHNRASNETDVEASLRQAAKDFAELMSKIAAAYPGAKLPYGGTEAPYTPPSAEELYKQAIDDYLKLIKRINENYKQSLTDRYEDFHANYLEATGQKDQAKAYRDEKEWERKRRDLVDSFGATIDADEQRTLDEFDRWREAVRKNGDALDDLTTSVRNAPAGFKVESYIRQFQEPVPYPMAPAPRSPLEPQGPLVPPMSPLAPTLPALDRQVSTWTRDDALARTLFRDPMVELSRSVDALRAAYVGTDATPMLTRLDERPRYESATAPAPASPTTITINITVNESDTPGTTAQQVAEQVAQQLRLHFTPGRVAQLNIQGLAQRGAVRKGIGASLSATLNRG